MPPIKISTIVILCYEMTIGNNLDFIEHAYLLVKSNPTILTLEKLGKSSNIKLGMENYMAKNL